MGCRLSSRADPQSDGEDGLLAGGVTDEQKELIRQSWTSVQSDATKHGVIMFTRLFEIRPECKDLFLDLRGIAHPEILASKALRAHNLRVMSFLEKTVARLDSPERLEQLLLELGRKHYHYNSNPEYYLYLGTEFIRMIKPVLKESWSSELDNAWTTLFSYLTQMMKVGFEEEKMKQRTP